MTQTDIKQAFIQSLGNQVSLEQAVEMKLVKENTMRNFLIVQDIQSRLRQNRITFYNILFELEAKYDLSVRQLARIYNSNRHFLKKRTMA